MPASKKYPLSKPVKPPSGRGRCSHQSLAGEGEVYPKCPSSTASGPSPSLRSAGLRPFPKGKAEKVVASRRSCPIDYSNHNGNGDINYT